MEGYIFLLLFYFIAFLLVMLRNKKKEIAHLKKSMKLNTNKAYRYSFSYTSCYPSVILFVSNKEYSTQEFVSICTKVIKKIVLSKIDKINVYGDGESARKYLRFCHLYESEFRAEMKNFGFEEYQENVNALFSIDAYSFIRTQFRQDVYDILFRKCKKYGSGMDEKDFDVWLDANALEFLIEKE